REGDDRGGVAGERGRGLGAHRCRRQARHSQADARVEDQEAGNRPASLQGRLVARCQALGSTLKFRQMLKLRLEHDPRLPVMRGNWHGTAVAMDSRDARGAVRRTHAEEELMKTPVVLITGALTGIGRATARAFATEGARVVVSGRPDDEGERVVAELRELGAEAVFLRADVRREDDVRGLVDKAVARFGRLDAAVNTAGTEGKPGPVTEQSAETYNATFETNVLGTLLSMKHELRVMLAQGHGSIVNVSSTYGRTGAAGASVYAASKHAVEGLTKSAALEAETASPFRCHVAIIGGATAGAEASGWLTGESTTAFGGLH